MGKTAITVPGLPQPGGAYSYGVVANGFFYTAGTGPRQTAQQDLTGTSVEEQTRMTLGNIEAILQTAGLSLEDVVKTTVHLHELDRDFGGLIQSTPRLSRSPTQCERRLGRDCSGSSSR